ncbi:hypothetical protein ACTS94_05920 [Empedobacter falsenii]
MKLHAGYIGDGISNILKNQFPDESIFFENTKNKEILKLKGLLELISNFSVSSNKDFEINYNKIPKILAVQNNIISRGLPTKSPILLENLFVEIGLSKLDSSRLFEYKFNSSRDWIS